MNDPLNLKALMVGVSLSLLATSFSWIGLLVFSLLEILIICVVESTIYYLSTAMGVSIPKLSREFHFKDISISEACLLFSTYIVVFLLTYWGGCFLRYYCSRFRYFLNNCTFKKI